MRSYWSWNGALIVCFKSNFGFSLSPSYVKDLSFDTIFAGDVVAIPFHIVSINMCAHMHSWNHRRKAHVDI